MGNITSPYQDLTPGREISALTLYGLNGATANQADWNDFEAFMDAELETLAKNGITAVKVFYFDKFFRLGSQDILGHLIREQQDVRFIYVISSSTTIGKFEPLLSIEKKVSKFHPHDFQLIHSAFNFEPCCALIRKNQPNAMIVSPRGVLFLVESIGMRDDEEVVPWPIEPELIPLERIAELECIPSVHYSAQPEDEDNYKEEESLGAHW
jgi:hypothetical protein